MSSKMGTALFLGVVLGVVSSVWADEVVHFTNGTSLVIVGHKVEKDMISIDLGANASMSFPLSMVERVENAGRNVFTGESYRPSNQATAGYPQPVVVNGPSNAPVPSRMMGSRASRKGGPMNPLDRFGAIQGASDGGDVSQMHPTPFSSGAVGQPVLGTLPMGRYNMIPTRGRPTSHSGRPIVSFQPLSESKDASAPPANTPPPPASPPEEEGSAETPQTGN